MGNESEQEKQAREYIERYADPNYLGESGFAAKRQLNIPIGEVHYKDRGEVKVARGPFELEFTYSGLENSGQLNNASLKSQIEFRGPSLRILGDLKLTRLDQASAEITLSKLLLKGYRVIFNPESTQDNATVFEDDKVCLIEGDLAKPNTLLGLIHEIGHIQEKEQGLPDTPTPQDIAEFYHRRSSAQKGAAILRSERNAWAYTFRVLKPFIDRKPTQHTIFSAQDLKDYIHDHALAGYTHSVKSRIGKAALEQLDNNQ